MVGVPGVGDLLVGADGAVGVVAHAAAVGVPRIALDNAVGVHAHALAGVVAQLELILVPFGGDRPEDALRVFGADEIVLSTHPEGRSHWLERGVVDSVRERFDVPVTHVVVDLERASP